MKKYIKLITALAAIIVSVATVKADSLFNGKEFGLSLGTGYVVDPEAAFQQDYNFNLNAGAFYYPWRNFGFEFNVPFYTTGVTVSEVQAGTLLRFPLSLETPFFRNLAPYVGVGGVYAWDGVEEWAYIGKVGTEFRLNKKWGFAVEGQYRNSDFDSWAEGSMQVVGALKLVF